MESFPVVGVEKTVCHEGKGDKPLFQKNSKILFHFRTLRLDKNGELDEADIQSCVIDDSRIIGAGPFELLIGREFKLSVWEDMVKSMSIGEKARFKCPYKLVLNYPQVAKTLRELALKQAGKEVPHSHTHSCGFAALQGTGHPDLDRIYQDRNPLVFELELLSVEQPGHYKKDSWAMTDEEKSESVDCLREEGNRLYKDGDLEAATQKYFEALHYLEDLSVREKPQSDEWQTVEERKVPLLLNYSQCMLLNKAYPEVIRHTTTVLELDPVNVKALYRRGKAHSACWNKQEAEADFARVIELEPSLSRSVDREVKQLRQRVREQEETERARLKGKLF